MLYYGFWGIILLCCFGLGASTYSDHHRWRIRQRENPRLSGHTTNVGARALVKSGISMDEIGYVKTNNHTLKAEAHENMFVLGDTTTLPTSKAGSVAHFSAEVMVENFMREINGEELKADFDGHANCFIETSFEKAASLILITITSHFQANSLFRA